MPLLAALVLLAPPQAASPPDTALESILEKAGEEADIFFHLAPRVIGTETLRHKGRKNPSRFRPRAGAAALGPPKPRFLEKEIVSEYAFGFLRDSPGSLREFRKVTAVDGRGIVGATKARQTLAANMASDDDRSRKKLLQNYEKHGLVGAVSDLGQLLLVLRPRLQPRYQFQAAGTTRLGADEVLLVNYRQKAEGEAAVIFHGNEMTRIPLEGQIWVRRADLVPVRITFTLTNQEDGLEVIHSGHVDYFASAHGVLLPVSVHYEKRTGGHLLVSNEVTYGEYKMFKVDAEIKFTPADEVPPR